MKFAKSGSQMFSTHTHTEQVSIVMNILITLMMVITSQSMHQNITFYTLSHTQILFINQKPHK